MSLMPMPIRKLWMRRMAGHVAEWYVRWSSKGSRAESCGREGMYEPGDVYLDRGQGGQGG